MTADFIKKALKAKYSSGITPDLEWVVLFEVRTSTGSPPSNRVMDGMGQRIIDAVAFNCFPSKQFKRIAFEIKVSRSDFIAEIKNPIKRILPLLLFDEFYFLTPKGLVACHEVPGDCGLIEVSDGGEIKTIKRPYYADKKNTFPFSTAFIVSLIRTAYLQGIKEGSTRIQFVRDTDIIDQLNSDINFLNGFFDKGKKLSKKQAVSIVELFNQGTKRIKAEHPEDTSVFNLK
jgi:hypothetical protein